MFIFDPHQLRPTDARAKPSIFVHDKQLAERTWPPGVLLVTLAIASVLGREEGTGTFRPLLRLIEYQPGKKTIVNDVFVTWMILDLLLCS